MCAAAEHHLIVMQYPDRRRIGAPVTGMRGGDNQIGIVPLPRQINWFADELAVSVYLMSVSDGGVHRLGDRLQVFFFNRKIAGIGGEGEKSA